MLTNARLPLMVMVVVPLPIQLMHLKPQQPSMHRQLWVHCGSLGRWSARPWGFDA